MAARSESRWGSDNYVEYVLGGIHSRLIISATHGGNLRPKCIPSRNVNPVGKTLPGGGVTILINSDIYTKEIATSLRDEIEALCGMEEAPHLIISHLHRSRVDMNRDAVEGCLGVPEAVNAHKQFHDFIVTATRSVGSGLLLDIHGHTHKEELLELGYLIGNHDLASGNLDLEKSSIRALASCSSFSYEDLIYGVASLGNMIQEEEIETVPSLKHPSAVGACFTGGHTVRTHGSSLGGNLDAIQVEIHRKYRSAEGSAILVPLLAKSVKQYLDLHYKKVGI